ncbi:MAG TPA: neutral/alkaline non-lysosomal ceramidase N-terminal domain-containing protein [Pyrinomonadaceae bacterium]|nr:neutral/alkaline non-lysosomal ceramidase N-terminal domain-containing protein [Pyrinomonadaceae bacterium]
MLKAGFSKVCISPPIGSPLAGFAAREGVSAGIHDDLYARALVVSNEAVAFALVSVDLLALPSEFVKRLRTEIQSKTGIRGDAVMIASTHTHAGPVTIRTFFNPEESVDAGYMNFLAAAIEESVSNAWRERFPARVGVGVGRVEGVGVNRRSPDQRPIDEQVGVIKVDDLNGRTRAVLMNYSCHPTVLGPDNLLVTGDFPNFAVEEIERSLGPDSLAMFVNGTQGNISMGHSSELSAIGVITPGRTFERAAELGHLLAEATLVELKSIPMTDTPELSALTIPVNLPLKDYPPLEEAKKSLAEAEAVLEKLSAEGAPLEEIMPAKTQRLYASITNFYARETQPLPDGHLPIELQGFRVGDAAFVAIPGEVFVEIGLALKQQSPHKMFVFGIANGYIGYVPTSEAFEVGGYEVVSSKCQAGAADVLIDEVAGLTKKLFSNHAVSNSPAFVSTGERANDR